MKFAFIVICLIFLDSEWITDNVRKFSFLAVISKPAGSMDSRAIPKVILLWYRPKVISETIKGGGGAANPGFMGGCVSRESSLNKISMYL